MSEAKPDVVGTILPLGWWRRLWKPRCTFCRQRLFHFERVIYRYPCSPWRVCPDSKGCVERLEENKEDDRALEAEAIEAERAAAVDDETHGPWA